MVGAEGRGRVLVEVAAVLFLAALAGILVAPALVHGSALGPSDVLRELGLTSQVNPHIHNAVGSDEIEEFIPWQAVAWRQVHAGHLPIWNPFSVLGMPLAFGLQSAPFSPAVALGYLFPLDLEHTVAIVARLLIGGTGAYVFGRVLGLRPLAAVTGASIFELSGAFTIWLGAYESGVVCFAGWVLAASVLIVRQRRRARAVALLALALALALVGGEPQIGLVLVGALAVFAAVLAFAAARRGEGTARRICTDHVLGIVAGGALVAPLYLPATQLGLVSGRAKNPAVSNLPLFDLTHLVFAGYNGVPTDLNAVIGPNNLYVAMVYVGVIALVLAGVAATHRRQRRVVIALGVTALGLGVALFAQAVPDLFLKVPLLRVFRLDLATPMLDFVLAMLAACGADALLGSSAAPARRVGRRAPDRALAAGTAAMALLLVVLGVRLALNVDHLDAAEAALRARSFLWPALSVLTCAALAVARALARTRGARTARGVAVAGVSGLLLVECAFLLLAGENAISSAAQPAPPSAAVAALGRIAGNALVGIGSCTENSFPNAAILPNANALYGIHELAVYDPILPASYYHSYGALVHASGKVLWPHVFCPAVTSVRIARFYGVSYVLEPPGVRGPAGMHQVAVLHGERLEHVPGSGRVTWTGGGRTQVIPASQPTPASWRVRLVTARPGTLVLRVTDVPGWQATIDGRPLALRAWRGLALSARVPAGRHVIVLSYWPRLLTVGLVAAAAAALGLVTALAVEARHRRAPAQAAIAATRQTEPVPLS